ncbi:ABC transporter permease [Clostridium senegalense]
MFKHIFIYEFEKFWWKKINILCFISIPIVVLISLKFTLETNANANFTEVIFSSNMNFHISSLQEMLLTAFNLIIIIFFILSFNEEYRKGNLRLAFSRAISIKKLYIAKILVLALNIFLMLIVHFFIAIIIANIFLPKVSETALFLKEGLYSFSSVALYTIKYYFLAYLTLIAFGSIVQFFSIKCKTITTALGASIGVLFINIIYMAVIISFCNETNIDSYMSISTIYTQFNGAASFAAGITNIFLISMIIIILFFQILSYLTFISEDYLE